jgi:hypothetical protein
MAEGRITRLSLQEAGHVFDRLPVRPLPATLHPLYVAADAARDPVLEPAFLCFESQGERWLHGVHITEVPGTRWRDASSPYGYGGPVATLQDAQFVAAAWRAYAEWMREARVVVEYVRFHPVLGNERFYGGSTSDNREVICMNLADAELGADYPVRLRQALAKARRSGLAYREDDFEPHARAFGAYHRAAMREMQADPFYVFEDLYFEKLAQSGRARLGWCVGPHGDEWLAAALFLDGPDVREYHLAAANDAGRRAGAASLLLHESALAARTLGLEHLYLGGGTDARADNPLLFFKSGFSRERLRYGTGWTVFDASGHDELKARFPEAWSAHPERPIFYRKV